MGISLPIGSHLDDAQARRTTRQAEDYFSDAGRRAGGEFSRYVNQGLGRVDTSRARLQAASLERAFDKAADAAGKLRIEEAKLEAAQASGTATNAQLIAHSERAERARRAEARAVREAANAVRDLHDAGRSSGGFMDNMGRSMDSLGTAARSFAMAGAPAAILAVGGAAITASGALAVLPAALSGVAAGVGTLVLGMQGFGDALNDMGDPKKFAEDVQKLAPAAQQTALEFKKLVDGPLGELRKATQESLFSGMAQEFHDVANVMLPSVKAATTGIASAFNGMAKGSLDQLMKPETATAFDATLHNITQAFTNLAPAAAPFTKAMTDIAQVGSSFLPNMSSAITNAATAFSQFISHAAETGQLANWIREGGDMLKQIGTLAWEFGRAIAALMPTAKTVFGYVAGGLHETADLLREHPGLIWGVVGAFGAWKTIQGTAALITSLTTISTALRALPAEAAAAGAGVSAGLSGAATTLSGIAASLAAITGGSVLKSLPLFGVGANSDQKNLSPDQMRDMAKTLPPDSPMRKAIEQGRLNGVDPNSPASWMGLPLPSLSGLPSPSSIMPGQLGSAATTGPVQPVAGLAPWSPNAVPGVPADGGAKKQPLPTVAAAGVDPMSLLQGFAPTASLYSAAGSVLDNQQKVAQAQSDLNTLLKSNTATESEITAKRNELQRAQREEHEAELRLMEAKQSATNKSLKSMQTTHDAMSTIGAGLDQDLGISKGLPGLADNLVRFVGHLAAAPLMAQLEAISKANPSQGGYGLTGVLAAQGVFGPDHTGLSPTTGPSTLAAYPGMTMGSSAAAAIALAQSANGGRYGWGASDLAKGLADCSGAVSDLVEIMQKGSADSGRLFDTESFPAYAAAHGWQRGLMPGALNVGVSHGGQGGGHMAATLPNGVNFESGGSHGGIAYGGPAAGAGDKQFTEQWYLPTSGGPQTTPLGPIPSTLAEFDRMYNPGIAGTGGAPMYPGTGYPNALPGVAPLGTVGPAGSPLAGAQNPTQIGAVVPAANGIGSGGVGMSQGGMLDLAMQVGGAGLDMLAPGAGQAAQTVIKLGNRAIQFGGQAAGIGVQGLMDTFLPMGGSQLAQSNWATRIIGGLAGALPAIPNMAGKKAPEQAQGGQGQGGAGNTTTVNHNTTINAEGRDNGGLARDWEYNTTQAAMTPAVGP